MSDRPATFPAFAKTLQQGVGKTMAELTLDITKHYESDDPRRWWMEWLASNHGAWDDACRDLGVNPPDHGPGYYRRLQAIVTPILAEAADRLEPA